MLNRPWWVPVIGRDVAAQIAAGLLLILAVAVIMWQVRSGFVRNNVELDWAIFAQPSQLTGGTYLSTILVGMWLTVRLALISIVLALLLGVTVGVARLSLNPVVSGAAGAYVEFFRNTPLLVQIFFWNFGVLNVLPEPLRGFVFDNHPELIAVIAALSIYTSAFIAETVRAGILSIPRGQFEASLSLGLTGGQSLRMVILPQALRIVIPPLGNQFLNLTKNTALASQIGVAELFYYGTQIQSYTFRGFESITAITAAYLILSLTIAFMLNYLNRRFSLPGARV